MIEGLKFNLSGTEVRFLFKAKLDKAKKNLAETNQLIDNVLTAREQKAKTDPKAEKSEVEKAVDLALAQHGILQSGGLDTSQEDAIIERVKGEVTKQFDVLNFYFEHIVESEIYLLTADEVDYLRDPASNFDGASLVRRLRSAKRTLSGLVQKSAIHDGTFYDNSEQLLEAVDRDIGCVKIAAAPYKSLDRL